MDKQPEQISILVGRIMYRLERVADPTRPETLYLLHGPRGACYGLLRSHTNHGYLFAANFTRGRKCVPASGLACQWFTDADGTLRPVGRAQ